MDAKIESNKVLRQVTTVSALHAAEASGEIEEGSKVGKGGWGKGFFVVVPFLRLVKSVRSHCQCVLF